MEIKTTTSVKIVMDETCLPLLKLRDDCYMCLFRGIYWCTLYGKHASDGQSSVGYIHTSQYLDIKYRERPSNLHILMLWLAMQACGNPIEEFRNASEALIDEFFYESIKFYNSSFRDRKEDCSTKKLLKCFYTAEKYLDAQFKYTHFSDIVAVKRYKSNDPIAYVCKPSVNTTYPYYLAVITHKGNYIIKQPSEKDTEAYKLADELLFNSADTIPDMALGILSMCGVYADTAGYYVRGPKTSLKLPFISSPNVPISVTSEVTSIGDLYRP